MEKCGQEKFKKLINSMKITPNKLKSIIRETIDELRTMGDMQVASLLGDPNIPGQGALRQTQDIERKKAEDAPLETKMQYLKHYITHAFIRAGFGPRAQVARLLDSDVCSVASLAALRNPQNTDPGRHSRCVFGFVVPVVCLFDVSPQACLGRR